MSYYSESEYTSEKYTSEKYTSEKKGYTTLDVTIKPEDCPVNTGVTGSYFKLEYGKGDDCVIRRDLVDCSSSYSSSYFSDCKSSEITRESSSETRESDTYDSITRESSCNSKENTKNRKIKKIIPLATFIQVTDIHIIDAANPSRSSFLAAYLPFIPELADAFRPNEIFSTQVAECMVQKINSIKKGPWLKQKVNIVVNTGDSADSMSKNELTNYINILDGGKVFPNPLENYVGVQDNYPASSYPVYYHPDAHPEGVPNDFYKVNYGYPDFQDILISAAKSFHAEGLNVPWYVASGNHDQEKLGNYSLGYYQILTLFDQIATGKIPELGSKLVESMSPVQAQLFIQTLTLQSAPKTLEILNKTQLRDVPASDKRLQFTRADFINMHYSSPIKPGPPGHGFGERNIEDDVLYYTFDVSENILGITLDSCNLNGNLEDPSLAPNGSFGRIQIDWLEKELRKHHTDYYNNQGQLIKTCNKNKLIMIFCHHTIETMNNISTSPTTFDNDPQRIDGQEFVKILHRYSNVIGLISGHEHRNRVTPFPDPTGKTQGFWEITTASHIDYPQQSRILEVGENNDNTLSIFCTMINHESPANVDRGCFSTGPAQNCRCYSSDTSCSTDSKYSEYSEYTSESKDTEKYTIEEMASISRELAYNDPFIVNKFDNAENRTGTKYDRNVELLICNPLKR